LTDGQVGTEDPDIQDGGCAISDLTCFFSVVSVSAPNSFLMTKLADFGRGALLYRQNHRSEAKMLELLYKLESPAMTNIRIDFPSGSESEQGFGRLPSLAGEQSALYSD
jgi:hypothetical protein